MKHIIKKILIFTSVLGITVIMAGCSGSDSNKSQDGNMEYYQTHSDADVKKVNAKMYTRSSIGGESKMGNIKFSEKDSGLKMDVDLKSLRPDVEYTISVFQTDNCTHNVQSCDKEKLSVNLPTLQAGANGVLRKTFMIRGLSARDLQNGRLVLERDGGTKAAWGKIEKTMF